MPACGVSPEAMAKAIASGSATRPTVMPAMTSCKNLFRLYSRRHRTDLGNQRLPQAEERTADMNSIMTGTRFVTSDHRGTKVQHTIHFGARLALKILWVISARDSAQGEDTTPDAAATWSVRNIRRAHP